MNFTKPTQKYLLAGERGSPHTVELFGQSPFANSHSDQKRTAQQVRHAAALLLRSTQYPKDMSGNRCYRDARSICFFLLLTRRLEQKQPNSGCRVFGTEATRLAGGRFRSWWVGGWLDGWMTGTFRPTRHLHGMGRVQIT